jgi:hypothetical protein
MMCSFFSRNSQQTEGVGIRFRWNIVLPAVLAQATFSNAILDGEMLIWNKRNCAFEPFKNILPVVFAASRHVPAGQLIKENQIKEFGEDESALL